MDLIMDNKICSKLAVCIPSILGTLLQRTVYIGPHKMTLSDNGYFDDFRHILFSTKSC